MNTLEESDVVLRLLHTADWHVGRRFPSFEKAHGTTLSRARLEVLDEILGCAAQRRVDAILCAGDLFDEPDPGKDWWAPVAKKLSSMPRPLPVFLLPGNHDPLRSGSVYEPSHAFRRALPAWVHVVDRDDFTYRLNEEAVLHARPCRTQAGQEDSASLLPKRELGNDQIRIGMVHGSTFGLSKEQINFPISKDAAVNRGFDYLALGDTHSFRNVCGDGGPPVVYPGAPESTSFDEPESGSVALVVVRRDRGAKVEHQKVGRWTWAERTVSRLEELRALRVEQTLSHTVLRLRLDLRLTALELEEAKEILDELEGTESTGARVGILHKVVRRMELNSEGIEKDLVLPEVLRSTFERLKALESTEQAAVARKALEHLYGLVRKAVP